MSRTGRPPLPEDERKAHMMRIRMTEAERSEIDQAAQAEETSSSEWARQVLLKAARKLRSQSKGRP